MNEITTAVQSVVDQKSYDNLHFDAASSHMLDSASFRDLLHLKNESSMLTFFTDHMERILEADVTTTSIASRFSRVQEYRRPDPGFKDAADRWRGLAIAIGLYVILRQFGHGVCLWRILIRSRKKF